MREQDKLSELIKFDKSDLPFETDFDNPPTLSRGVSAEDFVSFNGINCLFDWFTFTFSYTYERLENVLKLFQVDLLHYEETKGRYYVQYTYKRIYDEYIGIYLPEDYRNNKFDCRCCIELSGQACRLIEQRNDFRKVWLEFFNLMDQYNCSCTRIDLAIDDFRSKYFTLEEIMLKVRRGEYTCNSFNYSIKDSGSRLLDGTGTGTGLTIYLGSRESNREGCFYDKHAERINDGMEVWVDKWTRFELRHRHETAQSLFKMILRQGEEIIENFGEFVSKIFLGFIEFKEYDAFGGNDRDKNPSWQPWLAFLGVVEGVKVTNQGKLESTLAAKKNWYRENYSNFMNEIALADQMGFNQYMELTLLDRLNKYDFDDKRISRINAYRISTGQNKLTFFEFIGYINNLRHKNNLPLLSYDQMVRWRDKLFPEVDIDL